MRPPQSQRGQVLPFVALSLAILMGFGGLAVDVGYWEFSQRQQQNAADAAALGGAQQLLYAGCPNSSAATSAAQNDAANAGLPGGSNVTITVENPPSSGPFAGNNCAVHVAITQKKIPAFFTRLFGRSGGLMESTESVAQVSSSGNETPCIYLLSRTVSTNFNGSRISAPQCTIAINDTANFNGATVSAPYIGYAGAAPNENGANFTQATPASMLPVADPCPEIGGCAYLAAHPPSTASCVSFNGNGYSGTLSPGCYSNLNLNGATVTLQPGTYVFDGGTNFNGASVTGSGVTMYVTAAGTPPNFNGVRNMTLSPPSSGSNAGVLYYQVPSNTQAPNFNGTSETMSGLLYAPNATSVNFNGASGGYLVLVFGAANFNGSSAYDFAGAPAGGSLVKQAVMVQ